MFLLLLFAVVARASFGTFISHLFGWGSSPSESNDKPLTQVLDKNQFLATHIDTITSTTQLVASTTTTPQDKCYIMAHFKSGGDGQGGGGWSAGEPGMSSVAVIGLADRTEECLLVHTVTGGGLTPPEAMQAAVGVAALWPVGEFAHCGQLMVAPAELQHLCHPDKSVKSLED